LWLVNYGFVSLRGAFRHAGTDVIIYSKLRNRLLRRHSLMKSWADFSPRSLRGALPLSVRRNARVMFRCTSELRALVITLRFWSSLAVASSTVQHAKFHLLYNKCSKELCFPIPLQPFPISGFLPAHSKFSRSCQDLQSSRSHASDKISTSRFLLAYNRAKVNY
jgi:hypothetical protein